jgi:glycosyltransferase involved in cell wall biosynthesis
VLRVASELAAVHIAVDAVNLLHDRRGIGRYARAVLTRLCRQPGVRVTLAVPHRWPALVAGRLAGELGLRRVDVVSRRAVASVVPDVVWYPWNGMTWRVPLPSVATVHDVWPFVSPAERERIRRNEQTPFRTTAEHAALVLTDSDFSKGEIVRYLGVPERRIRVVPLGVDAPDVVPDEPLLLDGVSQYVLFVGESEPRKDLATLRRAMQALPDALRMTTGLLIVGKPGLGLAPRGGLRSVRRNGKKGWIVHFDVADGVPSAVTGEVADCVLRRLYAGAAVFAFPSRYEGFGLPVLEAMAHGAPVVASDAASIPEAGGDAALYVPPGDWEAYAAAIARVLSDIGLAAQLRAAGLARARTMSWERCAQQTLRVLHEAAAMRKGA